MLSDKLGNFKPNNMYEAILKVVYLLSFNSN